MTTVHADAVTSAAELNQLILALSEVEPNPYKVAQMALDRLATTAELMVALEAAFPQYVCQIVKRPHATSTQQSTPIAEPIILEPVDRRRKEPVKTYTDSLGNRRASQRQVGFLDAYQNHLNAVVKYDEGTASYKPLRDCTVDDLTWMADFRRQKAKENTSSAHRYEKLAQAMKDHGSATVADLDRAVGESILLG